MIAKVRTPATRVPGFWSFSFQPRSIPISRPEARAVPTLSAWTSQSGEPIGMPAQVIGHERRDKIIAMIVTGLTPQRQRNPRLRTRGFQQLRPQFLFEERIGR